MKKGFRKAIALLLALTMVMSMTAVTSFAATAAPLDGSKSAELTDREANEYKVSVQVPGGDGVKQHDEVIVMVDGSTSVKEEWPEMKAGILEIANEVLDGTGNTQITLMAFGISPTVVAKHVTTVSDLEKVLGEYQGDLLYGRSATNCAGAFDGVKKYIQNHDGTLDNAYVVFISDGGINMNSKAVDWIAVADNANLNNVKSAFNFSIKRIISGQATASEATKKVFGENLDVMLEAYKYCADNEAVYGADKAGIAAKEAELTEKTDKLAADETAIGLIVFDEEAVNALAAQIADLEAQVTAKAAEMEAAELQEEKDAIQADIDALNGQISTLKVQKDAIATEETIAQYESLKAEIETLKAELSVLEPEVAAMKERIQKFEESDATFKNITNATNEDGKHILQQWVSEVYRAFYKDAGMKEHVLYPIYDAETAYVTYDSKSGELYHLFYFLIGSAGVESGAENKSNAINSANSVAAIADQLYIVQYADDYRAGWMQEISGSNVNYMKSGAISNLASIMNELLGNITKLPYNDVYVTDYMSKWVNLQPETIKIYDRDNNVVAEFDAENSDTENGVYKYKWTAEKLCAQKDPVVLELVPVEEYAAGGADVEGNVSGDIYKITWNIKDGPLYRADNYRMEYDVTVDVNEEFFEYNTEYPANGNTDVTYTDENDKEVTREIEVPNVDVPKADLPEDEYYEGDESGKDEDGNGNKTELPDDKYMEDGKTENDKSAKTGDNAPIGALMAVAIAAMAAMAVSGRRESSR